MATEVKARKLQEGTLPFAEQYFVFCVLSSAVLSTSTHDVLAEPEIHLPPSFAPPTAPIGEGRWSYHRPPAPALRMVQRHWLGVGLLKPHFSRLQLQHPVASERGAQLPVEKWYVVNCKTCESANHSGI